MNIIDVIHKANAFLRQKTGITGDPDFVRLAERAGRPAWWISYNAKLFFPQVYQDGGVVDGGEYILTVDAKTGDVAVLEI